MTFCPECGTKNAPNTAFCSNCGKLQNHNFLGMSPPKTTQLKWVKGFNWFNFVFFLLAGSIVILPSLVDDSIDSFVFYFITFPLLICVGITYLLISTIVYN